MRLYCINMIDIKWKRMLPMIFLVCLMIGGIYFLHNISIGPDITNVNAPTFQRRLTHQITFTQQQVYQLENGFEDQEHPLLLKRLQTQWIRKPSSGPLKLLEPNKTHFSQFGQSVMLDKLLNQKSNGFFIECGAHDGEEYSNSLFFERSRNWTGLLIEPVSKYFNELLNKRRNAYSINACLNTENKTGKYPFYTGHLPAWGGLAQEMIRIGTYGEKVEVQCFTLYSIMKAIGITQVDLFSLDVEGAELGILKTIPFSYLNIDVFLIEYVFPGWGDEKGAEKRYAAFDTFLTGKGYKLVKKTFIDVVYRKIK